MLRTCALFVFKPSMEKCLNLSLPAHTVYASFCCAECEQLSARCRRTVMPHINLPEGLQGIRSAMAFRPEIAKPLNELAEALLHAPNSLPQRCV